MSDKSCGASLVPAAGQDAAGQDADDRVPKTHHRARAKARDSFATCPVAFSHVDSFDPKPRLTKDHGKPMPVKIERTQFNKNGKRDGVSV